MRLKTALSTHERMMRWNHPPGVEQPMEIYIAGRFGYLLTTDVWSSPIAVSMFSAKERRTAEQIVARHGQPSAEAIAAARAGLGADGELDDTPRDARQNGGIKG